MTVRVITLLTGNSNDINHIISVPRYIPDKCPNFEVSYWKAFRHPLNAAAVPSLKTYLVMKNIEDKLNQLNQNTPDRFHPEVLPIFWLGIILYSTKFFKAYQISDKLEKTYHGYHPTNHTLITLLPNCYYGLIQLIAKV